MKKQILCLLCTVITIACFAQKTPKEKAKDTILSFWSAYNTDIDKHIETFLRRKVDDETASIFKNLDNKSDFFDNQKLIAQGLDTLFTSTFKKELNKEILQKAFYNRKMIEKFKANEISSFFSGISNLSLQEYYATYNTNDKTISIGKNTSLLKKDKLNRLDWILKTGLTLNTSNEFGAVFKNGEFQRNNIVLNLGINKLAEGFVNFRPTDKINYAALVIDHRENVLKGKMFKKVNNYLDKDFNIAVDSIQRLNNKKYYADGDYEAKLSKYAKGRKNKYYSETAAEEINFIKKNSLYRNFETDWFSFNVNLPLGNQEIISANSQNSSTTETIKFNAYNANLSWNYLWKRPKGISYIVSPSLAIRNNNNFLANSASTVTFQTISDQGNNQQSITSQNQVFIGDYEEFVTTTFKLEAASLFIAESIGVRISYEKNFGDYDETNWAFGIPIIVKDKGKPVLNLELQYRNQDGDNLFGIGTSVLLKSLIN